MEKSVKKLKELESLLSQDDSIIIFEGIELLRREQPFEGAIGLLTSFYNGTDDFNVRKTIRDFMNDLKDQSVCVEVINEIRKQWKEETKSMLVSSCWQSGLNFSEYSSDLTEVFLRSDYVTAVECLTVIDESVNELSREKKDKIIKVIEENLLSMTKEKRALTLELLSILGR